MASIHYTYTHISKESGKIFYIGKGSGSRAYLSSCRSKEWKKTAIFGHSIEIMAYWNTHEEALEHEKLLIACGKDLNWPLVNKTSGGQGVLGLKAFLGKKHSDATKLKISQAKTGMKYRYSKKFSEANSGTKNPNWQGTWITPNGTFNTCREVAEHYKIDTRTVRARCKGYKEQLINRIKIYPPIDGWAFIQK